MALSEKCVVLAALTLCLLAHQASTQDTERRAPIDEVCSKAISIDSWPIKKEDQVCGADGILYPSQNALECISKHAGLVEQQDREKCNESGAKFDPCLVLAYAAVRKVCGSDNVTYNNVWHMVCTANMYRVEINVQHDGECSIECPYSPIYKPVCSTTDYTYANMEALKCRQILQPYIKNDFLHEGQCKRHQNTNPCHVTNTFTPACASNGRTYSSAQHIRCLKQVNGELKVLHDGACTIAEVEKIIGPDDVCRMAKNRHEWSPVCGTDKVTYVNVYRYLCTKMEKGEDLQVSHSGECGSFDYCREPEPDVKTAICGTDGVTYPHENALYCAQTNSRFLGKKHNGACNETLDDPCLHRGSPFLDDNGRPVCAANSVTFVSPQALWCAAKNDPEIKLIHAGECF
ncbi:serine protease inhibitor dipetalogastin-like [Neocloeon triangulifer]|uniref:serine protease inhibitor dipetalogastin-like n=1 Tax=Neocloeon triangulifer TaxID=2078957 RepID=UPI00286F3438|nr:serine protease inhibitor dipetalogastin-like [Neocloeon triangulifer]